MKNINRTNKMMKHERNINISGRRINLREITFKKYGRRYKLQKI